jgi:hypothetical protein
MARKGVTRHEARTRVIFNLPINHAGEEKAFYEIIGYLQTQQRRSTGVSGFTYSEPLPAVFSGFWWSENDQVWVNDELVLVTVDFQTPTGKATFSISEEMKRLKQRIAEAYRRNGSQQEEIWIVAHRVTRQT